MQFNELNLKNKVLESISDIGFTKPTYIQELVLPSALENKSLACKGKTGSGKTHCFLIPLANKIDENNKNLQAIILLPTRELAMQIFKRAKEIFANYDIKISLLCGGTDTEKEKEKITSTPQIIIGTATKIKEIAIDNGLVNLKYVNTFVIDEADMTLEMGFLNDVDKIASLIDKKAQFLVFSATIPAGLKMFIKKYFASPLLIEDNKHNDNESIEHVLYPVKGRNPKELLLNIINNINPFICLIFLPTKQEVNSYYEYLINHDVDCKMIHGDLDARERKRNIQQSLNGKIRFIVCSDIASRGIDIDGVSHVISIGFPKSDLNYYVHRAGRCGRNNYKGMAITLYNPNDKKNITTLENMGIKFVYRELKDGKWKETTDENARKKRKNQQISQLDLDIKRAINENKSKVVKPNYKKKVKIAVENVKKRHRRQVIRDDIKKQIKYRAIERTKGERNHD